MEIVQLRQHRHRDESCRHAIRRFRSRYPKRSRSDGHESHDHPRISHRTRPRKHQPCADRRRKCARDCDSQPEARFDRARMPAATCRGNSDALQGFAASPDPPPCHSHVQVTSRCDFQWPHSGSPKNTKKTHKASPTRLEKQTTRPRNVSTPFVDGLMGEEEREVFRCRARRSVDVRRG